MDMLFTYLSTNGDEVSGEILDLPDFDPLESKKSHDRLCKLLEGWTGSKVFELTNLETKGI